MKRRRSPRRVAACLRWRCVIAMSALLLTTRTAFGLNPALDARQYVHTAWKVRDGFAKAAITSIAQTADGYLWLGTALGLLRFDGVRAEPWYPPPNQRLPSDTIHSLLTSSDGSCGSEPIKASPAGRTDGSLATRRWREASSANSSKIETARFGCCGSTTGGRSAKSRRRLSRATVKTAVMALMRSACMSTRPARSGWGRQRESGDGRPVPQRSIDCHMRATGYKGCPTAVMDRC